MTLKGLCLFMEGHNVEPCGVCCPECGYAKNKGYMPKEGDIVLIGYSRRFDDEDAKIGIVKGIIEGKQTGITPIIDFNRVIGVIPSNNECELVGLSLARVEADRKERDEKLIKALKEYLLCDDRKAMDYPIDECLDRELKQVFAGVDKE